MNDHSPSDQMQGETFLEGQNAAYVEALQPDTRLTLLR